MHIFKKVLLVLITPLFSFLLFATALDYGFVHVATHPTTVKKLVADSGIYNSVVPNILSQNKTISTDLGDISSSDPAVTAAANKAVSPQFAQQNTEAAIDSIYTWLNGKTASPTFNVDLSGPKATFADSLSANIEQRLAALPACTTQAQIADYNALNATCLPPGTSPTAAAAELKTSLLSGKGFLDQTNLNATTIKNGGSNQSIFNDQLKDAPKQYQKAKKTPYLLALLAILAGTAIVFLSSSWQRGLRHLGITLVAMGVLMMAFSWALDKEVNHQLLPKLKIDNLALQTDVRNLVGDLVAAIDKNYWFFGGLYTVLGAGTLAWLWYDGRGRKLPQALPKKPPAKQPVGSD